MKLSEKQKELGITLSQVLIEQMGNVPRKYLGEMWRNGECERVEKIMVEAQKRFDSQKFNYKTIR